MKKSLIVVLFLVFGYSSVGDVMAYGCGLKPLPPLGCKRDAVCVCDSDGNCQWVFTNCR